MQDNLQQLQSGANQLQLPLSDKQASALMDYARLLQRWNSVVNLTNVTHEQDIITKHLLDSLSVTTFIQSEVMWDIGTGAGLPGVPLAIMLPDVSWHLVDSNLKKIQFIRQFCLQSGLKNITAHHSRIEQIKSITQNSNLQDSKYSVISRALAPPVRFISMVNQYLPEHDAIYLMLGREIDPDQANIQQNITGYSTKLYTRLTVPYLNATRHLWILENRRTQ